MRGRHRTVRAPLTKIALHLRMRTSLPRFTSYLPSAWLFAALLLLPACAPVIAARGTVPTLPHIDGDRFITNDGLALGYTAWEVPEPKAVIVAFHGMNDYANAYALPAPWLNQHGISVYAIDQRGFGRSPNRGIWPGTDALTEDARDFAALIRARHPDAKFFLLGESMGGAVVLAMLDRPLAPAPDGVILVAPAVWGWSTMEFSYRAVLWITAHTIPWKTVTGSGLTIYPSDNEEILRQLGEDDLVIKPTRTDAVYGIVGLMDEAILSAPRQTGRFLVLYGEKDGIVPRWPIERLTETMGVRPVIALYPDGYHLLLRDLQREVVWRDILHFIEGHEGPLPSGFERDTLAEPVTQ